MMRNRMTGTGKGRPWHHPWPGLVGVILLTTATIVFAAAAAKLIPAWDASDETSEVSIDHSVWQEILDSYLSEHPSGINRFDYGALKASAADYTKLAGYLEYLQSLDPRKYARAEQKPYWINFYNALTVQVVVDGYPVDTIHKIRKGILPLGPWKDVHARVAGMELTLDDIEHGILRPIWRDNRIHYGVNCASLGCPNLLATAFTAANTEDLLDTGAREYINHPRGVDFVDDDFVVISSIYDWFVPDFGDSDEGVIEHLVKYAEPELAQRLREFSGAFDYEYDWGLNHP